MSCFWSHKFSKVEPDGFQYCLDCQMARRPDPGKCPHEWETIKELEVLRQVRDPYSYNMRSVKIGIVYALRCKKCGDVNSKRISLV